MTRLFLLTLGILLMLLNSALAQSPKTASLPDRCNKILFLGDSITYQGDYVCNFTAYMRMRHPNRPWHVINAGVPSETVSGLSEAGHAGGRFPRPGLLDRLDRALEQTKPELVFACYGINDGIYQPLDESRFAKFREGIQSLHQSVEKAGARIIHLTPPAYDADITHNPAYVQVLDRYSQWLLDQRSIGWQVIDVHGPMGAFMAERKKSDPQFKLSKDGVHPTVLGHWIIAKIILEALGAEDVSAAAKIEDVLPPESTDLLKLVHEQHELLRDAYITSIGTPRPGLKKGIALPDAEAKSLELDRKIRAMMGVSE